MTEIISSALIRRKRVEELTTLSRTTIYDKMRAGLFPKCIHLGPRSVVWRLDDIEKWMAQPETYKAEV